MSKCLLRIRSSCRESDPIKWILQQWSQLGVGGKGEEGTKSTPSLGIFKPCVPKVWGHNVLLNEALNPYLTCAKAFVPHRCLCACVPSWRCPLSSAILASPNLEGLEITWGPRAAGMLALQRSKATGRCPSTSLLQRCKDAHWDDSRQEAHL